jgi:anti-sigma factor RsiW
MTHENSSPYLLGALNDLERQAYERHLMGCDTCQEELERLRPGVDVLAREVEAVEPPPSLKAGLMAVVEREAAQRRRDEAAARGERSTGAAWWRRPALAAAAAATLAVTGLVGYEVGVSRDGAQTITAQVDQTRLPGATGRLTRGDGGAVLRMSGLPDLPDDHVYAVWVDEAGELSPVALVAPTGGGTAQAGISGDLDDADGVYVTRQPADSVRTPSEEPVVSVPLRDS